MRFFPSFFPPLAAVLLLSCSSTRVDKGFYAPTQPKYAVEMDKEGRKHGTEVWWHANGKKKYQATNRAGVRNGKFTAWYPDGTKWYEGFESHGKPEGTLTYWHPGGKVKTLALFRDGIQLERKDFDESGQLLSLSLPKAEIPKEPSPDAEEVDRQRQAGLQMWALRVRQTVEGYWRIPKSFQKDKPYKAVAKISVGRDGKILTVAWPEKSASPAFNSLAQQTFKKIKRLPPFPPQVMDETLDIQYEFVSTGKPEPRKRLQVREESQGEEGGSEMTLPPGESAPD